MKRSGDQALDQALAFHRAPGYLAAIRRRNLPENLETLLRIAAGESEAVLQAAQSTGESPEALREVAIFYIQQLLFADDSDSYRVLGVNPDASDEQIKSHYRWLVRWLHPDRNPDEWESVFADRVNSAWQELRTPGRRSAYDLKRMDDEPASTESNNGLVVNRDAPAVAKLSISHRTVRWLPTIALTGIALFAVVGLLLYQQLQIRYHEPVVAVVSQASTSPGRDESMSSESAVPTAPAGLPVSSAGLPARTNPRVADAPVELPNATMPVASVAANGRVEARPEVAPERSLPPTPTQVAVHPAEAVASMAAPRSGPSVVANARIETPAAISPERSLPPRSTPIAAHPAEPIVRAASPARSPIVVAERKPAPLPTSAPSERGQVIAVAPAPIAAQSVMPAAMAIAPSNVQVVSLRPAQPVLVMTSDEAAAKSLIDERIAASLVSRFSQAYANGDTERLMQLFTHDAQSAHGDRRAIAEDYRRLFEASERRRIALSDLSWLAVGDSATIIASFESEVVPRGKSRGERSTGDIRFDLRQENGELRIYRLRHDNRRS